MFQAALVRNRASLGPPRAVRRVRARIKGKPSGHTPPRLLRTVRNAVLHDGPRSSHHGVARPCPVLRTTQNAAASRRLKTRASSSETGKLRELSPRAPFRWRHGERRGSASGSRATTEGGYLRLVAAGADRDLLMFFIRVERHRGVASASSRPSAAALSDLPARPRYAGARSPAVTGTTSTSRARLRQPAARKPAASRRRWRRLRAAAAAPRVSRRRPFRLHRCGNRRAICGTRGTCRAGGARHVLDAGCGTRPPPARIAAALGSGMTGLGLDMSAAAAAPLARPGLRCRRSVVRSWPVQDDASRPRPQYFRAAEFRRDGAGAAAGRLARAGLSGSGPSDRTEASLPLAGAATDKARRYADAASRTIGPAVGHADSPPHDPRP